MFIFLTILILLAAVLLILVVVIQNSKGGGLASGFSTGNQVLGVRKTTDFLEKTTWYLTAFIIVLSIVSTAFIKKGNANAEHFKVENFQPKQQPAPTLPGLENNNAKEAPAANNAASNEAPATSGTETPAAPAK